MSEQPTHPSDGSVGEVEAGGENDERDERRKSSSSSRSAMRKGAILQSSQQQKRKTTMTAAALEVEDLHIGRPQLVVERGSPKSVRLCELVGWKFH